jgi:hypothetical protein
MFSPPVFEQSNRCPEIARDCGADEVRVMEAVSVDNQAVKWRMDNKMLSVIGFNVFLHNGTDTRGFACCRNTVVLSVEVEFYILDTVSVH